MSLIIKDGTHNIGVDEIANTILKKFDNITNLRNITYEELMSIKGIGNSKACTLLATIELAKRINTKVDNINNISFKNTEVVYEYFKTKIGYKTQEEFYCIYLDSKNRIIKEQLLFIGTANYSMVHPREVFKEAYKVEDILITKRLIEVGTLLGIKILDHLIIGSNNYYSFLENGDI